MSTATAGTVIDAVLERFEGVKPAGRDRWTAKCPAHDDRTASLSVAIGNGGRVLLKCHAGCNVPTICGAVGMKLADLFPPSPSSNGNGRHKPRRIVTTHPYTDRESTLLYEVVRFEPKGFAQRRPDGAGKWAWSLNGTPRVLYRLPELMEADPDNWVFVVEGEKDADRLSSLGLVATTNAQGAGKWQPSYSESLRGRRVAIIPDNDEAGRMHADAVAKSLHGVAAEVRVITLPDLPPKGDVSDYLDRLSPVDAATAAADLSRRVTEAPAFVPRTEVERALDAMPLNDDERRLLARSSLTTDTGNAARFALLQRDHLRFCYAWGKWLEWTGKRWAPDERGVAVKRATETALSIFTEAKDEQDPDRRKALAEHALKTQKRERISAMMELAKPYLSVTPAELDADPMLLNCSNGTFDLRTLTLRPHRREDYITKLCRGSYNPDASTAVLRAFLARIFRTYPSLSPFIQKALGYSATGLTDEQVLFFLYGAGANGKTTLIDAVLYALGDYGGKADRDLLVSRDGAAHPTNVADLMGRRCVVCSETNEGGRFDEAKLKDLVGETRLKARFMRCDFFEFQATHKLWLYSNHRPIVRGTDLGFWRRMRLIPFIETIDDAEKDSGLTGKLQAEADGVLTWIIEGCRLWRAEGLGLPAEVAEATAAYRTEMDSIGTFIDDACMTGEKAEATAKDLYHAYTTAAEEAGEKPLSQKRFGGELAKRGFVSARDSYSGRKVWRGIGLRATVVE